MRLVAEQSFAPQRVSGPTLFQIWNRSEEKDFILRVVPFEAPGLDYPNPYFSLVEALQALRVALIEAGFNSKELAGLDPPETPKVLSHSRFDRDFEV